ncbi:MAG: excinuclease ABC subunit UvrC [Deltaproteobacteria bacterium]|nr:excinuclease ABC subunit UvrC [Deltaproteobacteria bacterium]
MDEALKRKLDSLPASPGVYLMKDAAGRVFYVGKAVSLRDRVRQYFAEGTTDERAFVPLLGDLLADIDVVLTRTDKEAYLLENELIKKHRPKFNVRLRDDKNYLSLRLDLREEFPKIERVRRPKNDGARYFGPFVSGREAKLMYRLANRLLDLRVCSDNEFRHRSRPCVQGLMGNCLAPCVKPDEVRERYAEAAKRAVMFLSGKDEDLIAALKDAMAAYAEKLEFEAAASIRDTIEAMEAARERQTIVDPSIPDSDVFGVAFDGRSAAVCMLHFRAGRMSGKRCYSFDEVTQSVPEVIGAAVGQYYSDGAQIPGQIVVPEEPEAIDTLAEALSEKAGRAVRIAAPRRGARADLIEMAAQNADHHLKLVSDRDETLALIKRRFGLRRFPRVIECFDISHLGGTHTVASRVTFAGGLPDKERYRHYHIRTETAGDDVAAMHEVLSRRFGGSDSRLTTDDCRLTTHDSRLAASDSGPTSSPMPHASCLPDDAPDLLLMDGGRAQLNAAADVLDAAGLAGSVDLLAIAKGNRTHGDAIYLPGRKNPVLPGPRAKELHLLMRVRDEAHRFGREFQQRTREKHALESET